MVSEHGLLCDCFGCDIRYDRRIKEAKAASILGISKFTLQKARWRGAPPSFEKHGRAVVYRARVIRELAESQTRTSTSDPGRFDEASTAVTTGLALRLPEDHKVCDE